MGRLPGDFFEQRTARQFRFRIFEDVVKACSRPSRYDDAALPWIRSLYAGAPSVALYAHVPWCVEECTYCYYWGKIDKRSEMQRLLEAERAHARLMDELCGLREKSVPSIYFGGGTPTVLPRDMLEEHLAFFTSYRLTPDAEVCVEASIGTLGREKLDVLERYATRLSIGVQAFNDRLLGMVARTFSREKAMDVLREAIARIPSVNIDLLYGLKTQTRAEFLESVETAIALETPSITLYRLEVRDDPPLVREYEAAPGAFPSEVECRVMRAEAKALLEGAGYRENLVGWFLKPKVADTKVYRERWEKQTPCVAFGPHVQNYGPGHFYINVDDKEEYIARVNARSLPIGTKYELGPLERMYILVLALWKSNRPVDLAELRASFDDALVQRFAASTARYVDWGLLTSAGAVLSLTPAGESLLEWLLGDLIQQLSTSRPAPERLNDRRSLPLL
ncbi:radical SAM protein [Sorangium sp. So ce394]|uniref:radical SAM protein n=1 Tax=Sorangium sp. So ce394 TaxID=3133310 RepID=UPI00077992F2|nr:hypothetical protein BE20_54890 [Sorangium cellulosum]